MRVHICCLHRCWLPNEKGMIYAFIVPVVLIIVVSIKLIIYNVVCQCQCNNDIIVQAFLTANNSNNDIIISLRRAVSVQNEFIAKYVTLESFRSTFTLNVGWSFGTRYGVNITVIDGGTF